MLNPKSFICVSGGKARRSAMRVMFLGLFAGGALLFGAAQAQEITLEAVPPVVVKTVPEAGSDQVDPGTAEIRITFSKEMQDGSWSWSTVSKESFPETAGKPKYDEDRRTCILPVKLQPGKTYAVWVNSQKFRNFKDVKGQPAVPDLLVFKTKG
jgi:RNA polymerase sigma-70 factor (ECF subfamily)